ncbi:hypothetical protein J6590_058927 [Homalodisca vitripennis]|nr:hypothetical protein J6590_058927 [Homalodisca vitripennis]
MKNVISEKQKPIVILTKASNLPRVGWGRVSWLGGAVHVAGAYDETKPLAGECPKAWIY